MDLPLDTHVRRASLAPSVARRLPLTAVLVTGPAHGTLTLRQGGAFLYQPDAGFAGTDAFTYQALDGIAAGGTATGGDGGDASAGGRLQSGDGLHPLL